MLILRRMLNRTQPRRAPIACYANAWLFSKNDFFRKNEKTKWPFSWLGFHSSTEACFRGPSFPETCTRPSLGKRLPRNTASNYTASNIMPRIHVPRLVPTEAHFVETYDAFYVFPLFWDKYPIFDFCSKKILAMRSRLLGFAPGGYPSHAYFKTHAYSKPATSDTHRTQLP